MVFVYIYLWANAVGWAHEAHYNGTGQYHHHMTSLCIFKFQKMNYSGVSIKRKLLQVRNLDIVHNLVLLRSYFGQRGQSNLFCRFIYDVSLVSFAVFVQRGGAFVALFNLIIWFDWLSFVRLINLPLGDLDWLCRDREIIYLFIILANCLVFLITYEINAP